MVVPDFAGRRPRQADDDDDEGGGCCCLYFIQNHPAILVKDTPT